MIRSRTGKRRQRVDIHKPGIPGGQTPDVASVSPEFERAFSIVAFAMNRFIVDHVYRAARRFDNDVEALILFGMLAHLNALHLVPPGSSPLTALVQTGRILEMQPKLRPVRIRDLAQITGRPRETVRRKLEHLRSLGYVIRLSKGWVYDVASVDGDMQALTMASMRRFLQAADIMHAALQDAAVAVRKEAATGATGR
jgi:hypothetical protein